MLDSLIRKLDSFAGTQLASWTLQRRSEDEMRHMRNAGLAALQKYVVLVRYRGGHFAQKCWWEAPTAAEAITKAVSALQTAEEDNKSCRK